jgi:hypothetical protein
MARRILEPMTQQTPHDIGIVDHLGVVDIVDLACRAVERKHADDDDGHGNDRRYSDKKLARECRVFHRSIM